MSFQNDREFDAASYVKVNTRLLAFLAKYPNGRIVTEASFNEKGALTIKASIYKNDTDANPMGTGHAFLERLDGDKVGEYTETVAVGRALAFMGFHAEKSIATSEEMTRFDERKGRRGEPVTTTETKSTPAPAPRRATAEKKTEPAQQAAPTQAAAVVTVTTVPASAPVQEAKQAQPISDVPKTVQILKPSRIFKPAPKNTTAN